MQYNEGCARDGQTPLSYNKKVKANNKYKDNQICIQLLSLITDQPTNDATNVLFIIIKCPSLLTDTLSKQRIPAASN